MIQLADKCGQTTNKLVQNYYNCFYRYNKTEDLVPGGPEMMSYSHLLIGDGNEKDSVVSYYIQTHKIMPKIRGIIKCNRNLRKWPPMLGPVIGPKTFILRSKLYVYH